MGLAPFQIKSVPGLSFFKFLGTGGGSGFSLQPDFSTYAFLGVWEKATQYHDFAASHPVFCAYREKTAHIRTLLLQPVYSHGKWSGVNPFQLATPVAPQNNRKAVVITRATLRWQRLRSFWRAVPHASAAIAKAKGVDYYKGIGEWPYVQQATLSIWDNFDSVKAFAYQTEAHAKIVRQTRREQWYKEDLFSRFELLSDSQNPMDYE